MKTLLFWIQAVLAVVAWVFMLGVLIGLVATTTLPLHAYALGKVIAWLLIGQCLMTKPLFDGLQKAHEELRAQREPLIVTGTGHRA